MQGRNRNGGWQLSQVHAPILSFCKTVTYGTSVAGHQHGSRCEASCSTCTITIREFETTCDDISARGRMSTCTLSLRKLRPLWLERGSTTRWQTEMIQESHADDTPRLDSRANASRWTTNLRDHRRLEHESTARAAAHRPPHCPIRRDARSIGNTRQSRQRDKPSQCLTEGDHTCYAGSSEAKWGG